jgi:nucleoid-associated protein Lsr2
MATKVIKVDDLDGAEGTDVEERTFDYAGKTYAIDLSEDNHKKLVECLDELAKANAAVERYLDKATVQRGKRSQAKSSVDLAAVRAWAKENDIEVSERGRIPQAVIDQFQAAH